MTLKSISVQTRQTDVLAQVIVVTSFVSNIRCVFDIHVLLLALQWRGGR